MTCGFNLNGMVYVGEWSSGVPAPSFVFFYRYELVSFLLLSISRGDLAIRFAATAAPRHSEIY